MTIFAVGSLVRARGREWVVLPESQDPVLLLRPLGGTDDEIAGIHTGLEEVEPAVFDLPNPTQCGDFRSCRLLRDAVRISSRAGAGPFRSFSRIAVEPRPYQLVPLLMALKLDPIRLLISDDVGIGKTVEAALIARELLDRGEIQRTAVLCPPHLADQWQGELRDKFHIDAELVLPSTAARLERDCGLHESLFERHPHVIVSMDFIKSERRRQEFVRACPEFVIVDEAHTCALGSAGRGGTHQRHELLTRLAEDQRRHLVLVTATPHSGKEEAFRSLLAFLDPSFANLPSELTGSANEPHRRRLAAHLVQRRRADIRHYLQEDTPFPERLEREETYKLSPEYRQLFDRVLDYAREKVSDGAGGTHRQRVRWWSALALLRSIASSPRAAAATLENRAAVAETETPEEADQLGLKTVFDDSPDDLESMLDVAPGGDPGDGESTDATVGVSDRRLRALAREARDLEGQPDAKLAKATAVIRGLVKDGFHPIVFCRFIPTAEYVAEHLREALPKGCQVEAVTGLLPPADREARIEGLGSHRADGKRIVLVCTDCLSEGINLQEHFDAVVHYDLAWNPTRHEQREGRVDRFGQPRDDVRVVTLYGTDNAIDGIVLDVLLRKHTQIRSSLGVSVPVPLDTNQVMQAVLEGLLLRGKTSGGGTDLLPGFAENLARNKRALHTEWEKAADREKRSRTVFAQESIKVDEVGHELAEARRASGSPEEIQRFTLEALRLHEALVREKQKVVEIDLKRCPRALRDLFPVMSDELTVRFDLPVADGVHYLSRTHPLVEGLAAYLMDTALDPALAGMARRAGAIRTSAVSRRTSLLLCRFRFDVLTRTGSSRDAPEESQLAEECGLVAFEGAPESASWLDSERAEGILAVAPTGNMLPEQAIEAVRKVVEGFEAIRAHVETEAARRAQALLDAHRRVRQAARMRGLSQRVQPQLPVDVLGLYVLLPDPTAATRR